MSPVLELSENVVNLIENFEESSKENYQKYLAAIKHFDDLEKKGLVKRRGNT